MKSNHGLLILAFASALALAPHPASAQVDHLVCYKVVDKTPVAAAFDLFAELQPEFSARGCRVVKVVDFCVPASKRNVEPASADTRADIVGPPLYVDYIGYLVKCEQQLVPPNKVVIDQFGVHRHRRYKLERVYVPAKKGPPPCGTVDGKMCGGVCPNPAHECRVDSTDNGCRCLPPEDGLCGGKPDKQGLCGGPCPDPTNQCQFLVTAAGDKVCACGPPPPPVCSINAATGTCGGECPNKADKCVFKSNHECTCEPATTPCAPVPGNPAACGGDCPIVGDVCALADTGVCTCGPPPPTPCQQNPLTGTCGGECPAGEKCQLDADGTCACGPLPCGSDANGQCTLGACPDPVNQACKLDASGACNCDPPSCGVVGANTCGGVCPAPRECLPFTAGGSFQCRCQ